MIIESSAILVKSKLAKLLVNFRIEPLDREAIVLDIVEFIALRLDKADDDQVFNLALFVSTNLAGFVAGTIAYIDVHIAVRYVSRYDLVLSRRYLSWLRSRTSMMLLRCTGKLYSPAPGAPPIAKTL